MKIILTIALCLFSFASKSTGQEYLGARRPLQQGYDLMETSMTVDSCKGFYQQIRLLQKADQFVEGLMKGKEFVESCGKYQGMWPIFNQLLICAVYSSNDPMRYVEHREYLKSVLYLNTTDSDWYCSDVETMLSTFQYSERVKGYDDAASLSVIKFLLDNNKCPMADSILRDKYTTGRSKQYFTWMDTVTNATSTPYDSTLLTLTELGLDILINPPQQAYVSASGAPRGLSNVSVTENPFKDETSIVFELEDQAVISLEVFDVTGRVVWTNDVNGVGYLREHGRHEWKLSGKELPQGTLYARLSTNRGDVKTLKLVRK